MLQDDACPDFNALAFADRMVEIYLPEDSPASASVNIYLGLAVLENKLQRWQPASDYVDLYLTKRPDNVQGLLMKLHFGSALGKVEVVDTIKTRLLKIQERGGLTVGQQQNLSLYLEK